MKVTEKEYYDMMYNFSVKMKKEDLFNNWYKCFFYIIKKICISCNEKTINSLFYFFEMDNWKSMHIEKTQYKNFSKRELLKSFCNECEYIADRVSYDRLFRTHWLFRQFMRNYLEKQEE